MSLGEILWTARERIDQLGHEVSLLEEDSVVPDDASLFDSHYRERDALRAALHFALQLDELELDAPHGSVALKSEPDGEWGLQVTVTLQRTRHQAGSTLILEPRRGFSVESLWSRNTTEGRQNLAACEHVVRQIVQFPDVRELLIRSDNGKR